MNFDYTIQIHGALRGGVLFLNDTMSVYRLMTNGSWSQRTSADPQKGVAHWQQVITMLSVLDKDTAGKYGESIEWCIRFATFSKYQIGRNFGGMLQPEYAEFFDKLPVRAKLGAIRRAVCSDLACLKRIFK